jgi:hypothetical protein
VRERRILKAIKSKDEGSLDKGNRTKEASVILQRKTSTIHSLFSKTTEKWRKLEKYNFMEAS